MRQLYDLDFTITAGDLKRLQLDPREYVECNVSIGNTGRFEASIRLKGNGSFNGIEGKPNFTCKLRSNSLHVSNNLFTSKFYLNNCTQDTTFLRDVLARRFYGHCEVPTAEIAFATVRLNGRELGLYTVSQGINTDLMEGLGLSNFETLQGGSGEDVASLLFHDKLLGSSMVSDIFDKTNLMRLIVAECLMGNEDGYVFGPNNYWIYGPKRGQSWKIMPHTSDRIFCNQSFISRRRVKGVLAKSFLTDDRYRRLTLELIRTQLLSLSLTNIVSVEKSNLLCQIAARQPESSRQLCFAIAGLETEIKDHFSDLSTALDVAEGKITHSESYRNTKSWQVAWRGSQLGKVFGDRNVLTVASESAGQNLDVDCPLVLAPGPYALKLPLKFQPGMARDKPRLTVEVCGIELEINCTDTDWQSINLRFNASKAPSGQLFECYTGRLSIHASNFHGRLSINLNGMDLRPL